MKIQITNIMADGSEYMGLEAGSVHDVVPSPVNGRLADIDDCCGVWVMGVTKPVLVLRNEFIII